MSLNIRYATALNVLKTRNINEKILQYTNTSQEARYERGFSSLSRSYHQLFNNNR